MKTSDRKEIGKTEPQRLPFFSELVATGFYSGYIPGASGTIGSLVGLLIYLIPGTESLLSMSLMIILGFFTGVFTSAKVAAIRGHELTQSAAFAKEKFQPDKHSTPDPSIVVIDEIVGMWIALLLLPKTIVAVAIAFVAFRIFDIVKPPPAAQLERLPNGWGIMLDDVIAGIYANVTTYILYNVLRRMFAFM